MKEYLKEKVEQLVASEENLAYATENVQELASEVEHLRGKQLFCLNLIYRGKCQTAN